MRGLTPPSRVARGPGLPALQAHDPPIRHRDDPANSSTLTPAAFFRPPPCGWNHAGSISARAAAADCPRTVPFVPQRERSSRLRRTCRVSRAQHNAPRRCSFAMDVARGAADPGPFHTPPARRSRFCSASQRNQVYADCVNLSALLRCAGNALTTRNAPCRYRHRSRSGWRTRRRTCRGAKRRWRGEARRRLRPARSSSPASRR